MIDDLVRHSSDQQRGADTLFEDYVLYSNWIVDQPFFYGLPCCCESLPIATRGVVDWNNAKIVASPHTFIYAFFGFLQSQSTRD